MATSSVLQTGNLVLVIDTYTISLEVVHSIIKHLQFSKQLLDRVEQLLFLGDSPVPVPLTMDDDAHRLTSKVFYKRKPRMPDGASPEANNIFLRGMLEGNTMRMFRFSSMAHAFLGMREPKECHTVIVSGTPSLATKDVNWKCAVAALEALGASPSEARRTADAAWEDARVLASCGDDADPAVARCRPSARAAPLPESNNNNHQQPRRQRR